MKLNAGFGTKKGGSNVELAPADMLLWPKVTRTHSKGRTMWKRLGGRVEARACKYTPHS